MMSVIINTCAGSDDPYTLNRVGTRENIAKDIYYKRVGPLEETLRRYAREDIELIVVGEWHEGEGYTYIEDIGKYKDPGDQGQQRFTGQNAAKGDTLIFMDDDHYIEPRYFPWIEDAVRHYGAVGFLTHTLQDGTININWEQALNEPVRFISGHAGAYSQSTLERTPWPLAKDHTIHCCKIDVIHSKLLHKAKVPFCWRTYIPCWDIEEGVHPDE